MLQLKTIILCVPSDYGFSNTIKKALQKQGFIVQSFPSLDYPYRYKRLSDRLYNCFRKVFLRDNSYKSRLKMQERNEELFEKLKHSSNADYALFIRPDLYPLEFVQAIKQKAKKVVAYQWDGLDRFPEVYKYIDHFDRFFVFDQNDLSKSAKVLPLTNFYIEEKAAIKIEKAAYFIGTFDQGRFEQVNRLKSLLVSNNMPCHFSFITGNQKHIKTLQENNFILSGALDYKENLQKAQQYSMLVDIHSPIHNGLSFRIFEALYYGKKLITTNSKVQDYDFYHPNNIFVWNGENDAEMNRFLQKDYVALPTSILEKYSFENWINYVLGIEQYQEISLPKAQSDKREFQLV